MNDSSIHPEFDTQQQIFDTITDAAQNTPLGKEIMEKVKAEHSIFKIRNINLDGTSEEWYKVME